MRPKLWPPPYLTSRLLLLCVALVVPLAIASMALLKATVSWHQQDQESLFSAYAQSFSKSFTERFARGLVDVQMLGHNQGLLETDSNRLRDFLDELVTTHGDFDLILVTDLEGNFKGANHLSPSGTVLQIAGLHGMNFKEAPWLRGALNKNGFYIDEVQHDDTLVGAVYGGKPLVWGFSAVVSGWNGAPSRVVLARSSRALVDVFKGALTDLSGFGAAGLNLALVTTGGKVLYSYPEAPPLSKTVTTHLLERQALSFRDAAGGGSARLVGLAPLRTYNDLNWTLMVEAPEESVLAVPSHMRYLIDQTLLSFVALALAVGAFLVWWINWSLMPVTKQLRDETSKVQVFVDEMQARMSELTTQVQKQVEVAQTAFAQFKVLAEFKPLEGFPAQVQALREAIAQYALLTVDFQAVAAAAASLVKDASRLQKSQQPALVSLHEHIGDLGAASQAAVARCQEALDASRASVEAMAQEVEVQMQGLQAWQQDQSLVETMEQFGKLNTVNQAIGQEALEKAQALAATLQSLQTLSQRVQHMTR